MRRLMYTAFVAFWSSVATLWLASVLAEDPSSGSVSGEHPAAGGTAGISTAELARHASPEDCWIAVDGIVYDISDYIAEHPTPPGVVTRWCGKDATEPYSTKGYGAPHSPAADARLAELEMGRLTPD